MSGNSQQGGTSLHITNIPSMSYYPQRITIKFWYPCLSEPAFFPLIVYDCDFDDPTCEQYYSSFNLSPAEIKTNASSSINSQIQLEEYVYKESKYNIVIYDIQGRVVYINELSFKIPQIILIFFHDQKGALIQVSKSLIMNSL